MKRKHIHPISQVLTGFRLQGRQRRVYKTEEQVVQSSAMSGSGFNLADISISYHPSSTPVQTREKTLLQRRKATARRKTLSSDRAVSSNQDWGRKLGWSNRFDEIVLLFQQRGFLPSGKTPDPVSFANAVRKYQRKNPRLKSDGIIGPNTWRQIQAALASSQQQKGQQRSQSPAHNPWITIAEGEIGVREIQGERHSERVLEYHATTGRFSDDETPWCASFVNWVLRQAGQTGTGSARALSFRDYGTELKRPAYGSIAVFSYGGGRGHVGFVVGRQGNKLLILGGNQGNQVQVSAYPTSQIVAYVVPPGYQVPIEAYNLVSPEREVASGGGVAETR